MGSSALARRRYLAAPLLLPLLAVAGCRAGQPAPTTTPAMAVRATPPATTNVAAPEPATGAGDRNRRPEPAAAPVPVQIAPIAPLVPLTVTAALALPERARPDEVELRAVVV